jgi:hypothetical protein
VDRPATVKETPTKISTNTAAKAEYTMARRQQQMQLEASVIRATTMEQEVMLAMATGTMIMAIAAKMALATMVTGLIQQQIGH